MEVLLQRLVATFIAMGAVWMLLVLGALSGVLGVAFAVAREE